MVVVATTLALTIMLLLVVVAIDIIDESVDVGRDH